MDTENKISNNPLLSIKPIFVALLLMIVLAFAIKTNLRLIPFVPASSAEHLFSAERAKNMLSDLLVEQVPHPVDSTANRLVESRIVEQLRAMGYQEEIQQTKECRDFEVGVARCTEVRNIIVTIDGTHSSSKVNKSEKTGILLVAHYDSVGAGPGASDAGSAVATLLEIARLLAVEARPRNSIVILFNEGEEFGLFGAHAFMRQHPLADTLKLAINIEARGSDGQSVMFETGENSGWLVEEYIASTPQPLSSSLFYEVYKILPNDTDLTVFKEHGLQGLNFAHGGNEPHYHTPLDNLENLKLGTIQHHGENVWGVLKRIKDKDFSNLNQTNIVYTDIIGQFVVKWQQQTSLYLSIILTILFILVVRNLAKQSQLNGHFILRGVATFFILFVLLSGLALLVQKLTQLISGGSAPWRVDNFPMQLSLWSGLTLVGFMVGRWFVKKTCPINFLLGLQLCWLVLAIVTSIFMVGISFMFIIPSIVMITFLLALPWLKNWFSSHAVAVVLVTSSMAIGIIFLPIVYVLELMVSYQMSLAIGLMLSFVISSMTPLLAIRTDALTQLKKIYYLLAIIFVVGVSWTITQPAYTASVPQSINMTHVQHHDGKSFIIAGTANNLPSESLYKLLTESQTGQAVAWSNIVSINQEVDNLSLSPAVIDVVSSKQNGGKKTVQLRITARDKNFRDLILYIPSVSELESIEYAGKSLIYQNEKAIRNGFFEFRCRGLQCQNLSVTLRFSTTEKTEILVVKSLSGLPVEEQNFVNSRGAEAVQRQFGDRTVIITKLSI